MPKVKRYITEEEDRLLKAMRAVSKGDMTDEYVNTAIAAVKAQRPLDVAHFRLDEKTIEEATLKLFGKPEESPEEEPTQAILIEFD